MNILLCIDDTDQKGSPGTGHLLKDLCEEIEIKSWGKCSAISRHQLFIHDDIPYTSHNSAMCSEITIRDDCLNTIINFCGNFLKEKSAPGSDPGLCVAVISHKLDMGKAIVFGKMAKKMVLTKDSAYKIAKELDIHLSEHGGTGQGVVGSVAGVGLRLSENDGRFRGWYDLGRQGDTISVKELKSNHFIDAVKSESGEILLDETVVCFGEDKLKTVLKDAMQVVLVKENRNAPDHIKWKTLIKQEVKAY